MKISLFPPQTYICFKETHSPQITFHYQRISCPSSAYIFANFWDYLAIMYCVLSALINVTVAVKQAEND